MNIKGPITAEMTGCLALTELRLALLLNFSAPADPPGWKVRETAMETGCEMNPAKRGMNMNIRAIRVIRGKILDMSDGRYLSSNA